MAITRPIASWTARVRPTYLRACLNTIISYSTIVSECSLDCEVGDLSSRDWLELDHEEEAFRDGGFDTVGLGGVNNLFANLVK